MENYTIKGNPTKKFFIEMITRDISIEDAIIDLIDNSIDAASYRSAENYRGKEIKLTVNENEFIIQDNCGGFSLETAQKYAFRFGRPDKAPVQESTIGRFGIGMKRALFKIGKHFSVESQRDQDHFIVNVNVDEWSRKTIKVATEDNITEDNEDWSFQYVIIDEKQVTDGTIIKVQLLTDDVKTLFSDKVFINTLFDTIRKMLYYYIDLGLTISLNGKTMEGTSMKMFISSDIYTPYVVKGNKNGVNYTIIEGLGEVGDPSKSGWYIFCNNRLVLEADRSSLTQWGVNAMPKWHVDHVMFRGIIFLDSKETIKLPLTTTKKGIDASSELYQFLIQYMREGMTQIFSFLKRIPEMGENANEYRKDLAAKCKSVSAVELKRLSFEHINEKHFRSPVLDIDTLDLKEKMVRIAFDVPKELADKIKEYAQVKTYKDLGKLLFDYYQKMEGLNDEEW